MAFISLGTPKPLPIILQVRMSKFHPNCPETFTTDKDVILIHLHRRLQEGLQGAHTVLNDWLDLSQRFWHEGTIEINLQSQGTPANNYYIYSSWDISVMVTEKNALYICGHCLVYRLLKRSLVSAVTYWRGRNWPLLNKTLKMCGGTLVEKG